MRRGGGFYLNQSGYQQHSYLGVLGCGWSGVGVLGGGVVVLKRWILLIQLLTGAERVVLARLEKIDVFSNFNHLFGVGPFV